MKYDILTQPKSKAHEFLNKDKWSAQVCIKILNIRKQVQKWKDKRWGNPKQFKILIRCLYVLYFKNEFTWFCMITIYILLFIYINHNFVSSTEFFRQPSISSIDSNQQRRPAAIFSSYHVSDVIEYFWWFHHQSNHYYWSLFTGEMLFLVG